MVMKNANKQMSRFFENINRYQTTNNVLAETAGMIRMTTNPRDESELNDLVHHTRTQCANRQGGDSPSLDRNKWTSAKDLHDQVMQLLSTKLTPFNVRRRKYKLDVLKKCSFYLEVGIEEAPLTPDGQQTQPNVYSTLLHMIDPWKFQRMKKLGHSQVLIQLSLLEGLHEQLCRAKVEMEAIASMSDYGDREVHRVKLRIAEVTEALAEFDRTLTLGPLHTKHRLLTDTDSAKMPPIHLRLSVRMPVTFDRSLSEAQAVSARLHWEIGDGEELRPGEHFEIHHKLLLPATAEEGSQVGMVTCEACCVQVDNLLPQKCYEFTVKRADTTSLVYGFWNDTVVLRTMSVSPEGSNGSPEKRPRRFLW
ncbi:hypothetical protein DPEC_G00195920 [Dallia pectoralis]|uniref:Uncharacterized protein n=1 Tax=Dallia pectoralis TaxID=75939 RepID=A0ACC2G7J5_DALPE|nr:hypothetical protein DPEC_G00195920 [Dallia pectoralis]